MQRYFFQRNKSPTFYNIAEILENKKWQPTKLFFRANFGEKNLNYNQKIANQLEYKHLLTQLVSCYCPEIMPKTYCVNDKNWNASINLIKNNKQDCHNTWILKPALLNNGKNIHIFNNIKDIQSHFLQFNRIGGEHVLQEYIATPHLLKGPKNTGHKYSIRMFMILTNYDGAFLYPHGYFNIAVTPYDKNNIDDLTGHITNEHLQENRVNIIQIPSFKYDLFKPIYPEIKIILSKLIAGLKQQYPDIFLNKSSFFHSLKKIVLFGMDFIVDETQKVWLIEANHGPCFPIDTNHDLQKSLYQAFWTSLIDNFVQPIADKTPVEQINYSIFERLD